MPDMKRCTACGDEFPRNDTYFGVDLRSNDGLAGWCRVCKRRKNAGYRAKSAGKSRRELEMQGGHEDMRRRYGAFDLSGSKEQPYRCTCCRDTWATAAEAEACCGPGGAAHLKEDPDDDGTISEIMVKFIERRIRAGWSIDEMRRTFNWGQNITIRHFRVAAQNIADEDGITRAQLRNITFRLRRKNGHKGLGAMP